MPQEKAIALALIAGSQCTHNITARTTARREQMARFETCTAEREWMRTETCDDGLIVNPSDEARVYNSLMHAWYHNL